MSRGGILWRGLLVAILAVAVASCERVVSTTHFKATIRVDGRDYTSDVVGQILFDVVGDRSRPHPYGRVMTFRLPDDRVIVLGTRFGGRLKCVPRLDKSDTGCKARWSLPNDHLLPDGFIFDSATNPTVVEAFQFEPRDPDFVARGNFGLMGGHFSVPISNAMIETVHYSENPSRAWQARDTLDRDFPGYNLTAHRTASSVITRSAILAVAGFIQLPQAKDR